MTTKKLTAPIFATQIHPRSRQELSEGNLPVGTLVRSITTETVDVFGPHQKTWFEASQDGVSWFPQFTFGSVCAA